MIVSSQTGGHNMPCVTHLWPQPTATTVFTRQPNGQRQKSDRFCSSKPVQIKHPRQNEFAETSREISKSNRNENFTLIEDLGCTTNIEVIKRFVSLDGKYVIDAGCGGMDFTRQLPDAGARVLAIDPDPVQAELNRAAEPIPNVEFVETGSENIPADANTVDGVFFSYSLHHIPQEFFGRVFHEVFRVLRPDGFLYVIEPTGCPLNDVMKLFHDEDAERAAAQQALVDFAIPAFDSVDVVNYHSFSQYDSFDHFARHYGNRSFNSMYTEADVRRPAVQEAFERLGQPDYRFKSPKQVMCLRGLRPAAD